MSTISKLIDRLNEHASILQEFGGCEPDGLMMSDYREAVDTIQLLSEKLHTSQMERSSQYYNDGWIPVEETDELPKKEVLCINKYGETMYGILRRGDNLTTYYAKNIDGCFMTDCVAWSPLKKYQPKDGE